MTILYPRERIEAVLLPLTTPSLYRISLKTLLGEPLACKPVHSRFSDGQSYSVLYAAGDWDTCFRLRPIRYIKYTFIIPRKYDRRMKWASSTTLTRAPKTSASTA
jgi:hypothetical protein